MNIDPVDATVIAAFIAGAFMFIVEVVKRRTPSAEKESEQEDQWRKELWEINRTLSADLAMTEKHLKETRRLLEQSEAQTALLQQQNDLLRHDKAAWEIEREEMKAQIRGLRQEVYDLNTEVRSLQRRHDETNGGLR